MPKPSLQINVGLIASSAPKINAPNIESYLNLICKQPTALLEPPILMGPAWTAISQTVTVVAVTNTVHHVQDP